MARFVLAALLGLAVAAVGCASPDAEPAGATGTSAYTVDRGDRFVVSASPERVELRKSVDGVAFPKTADELQGKALLIHPIARKAEEGVYARAVSVADEGDRLVVTTEPLTLDEMTELTEDDVVRIFIDASKLNRPAALAPRALGGGAVFEGLDFGAWVQLSRPDHVSPGFTFDHTIQKADLRPDARVAWSREDGLEIGARLGFDWASKLTLSGTASGTIYESKEIETPSYVVTVPIGIFPVPVSLSASAQIECTATLSGPIETTVAISASARIGGSVRVKPQRGVAPSEWFHVGSWAPEATGDFDVHLEDTHGKLDATVDCSLPNIDFHARVAGVAGPKLSIVPVVSLGTEGAELHVDVLAGVDGALFGSTPAVQMKVWSYKP